MEFLLIAAHEGGAGDEADEFVRMRIFDRQAVHFQTGKDIQDLIQRFLGSDRRYIGVGQFFGHEERHGLRLQQGSPQILGNE